MFDEKSRSSGDQNAEIAPVSAGVPAALGSDLLRGVDAIAGFIAESKRRTYYLLENRLIPAGKQGACWIASRRALTTHYERLTGGGQ
jgi:hypothetical protein